jgi:ABC-type lipoprotein export system ATPase subunit
VGRKGPFFYTKALMNKAINLSAVKLKKKFKQIDVLQNISVNFEKGRTYALTGESGSGKSTFMHLLSGLDQPTAGKIMIGDHLLSDLTPLVRAQKIGFVVQTPTLISELTVLENIMLPAQILGIDGIECKKRAYSYLDAVDLFFAQSWHIGQLSGGQRQRIAFVRALMVHPDFLLADEPTGNLDDKNSDQLMEIVTLCQKKWNMGLIISSHCAKVAQKMEVVFTLKDGILVRTS